MARFVFNFFQATLDDGLSCNSGVVGTGHPEGDIALHAMKPNLDVL